MSAELQQVLIKLETFQSKLETLTSQVAELEKWRPKQESITSFVLSHEEIEAKKLIEKEVGFEMPRVCGYQLLVKIYIREDDLGTFIDKDGKEQKFYRPKEYVENEKYSSMVGLVVNRGPWSFVGDNFKYSGPTCRIGDFVVFPRHEGPRMNYRGLALIHVPDYMIYDVIEDPRYIEPDKRLEDPAERYRIDNAQSMKEKEMQEMEIAEHYYKKSKQQVGDPTGKKFFMPSENNSGLIMPT